MKKRVFPLSRVYQLLEPGPVVMVSTSGKTGPNVMPMSWHTMMEFEPPLVGCIISNRNFTFDLIRRSRECVINIPTVDLAQEVVACGNSTGRRINKFEAFGLTPLPASCVSAPLIAECYANLECKVVDSRMVAKYNLFVVEVLKAWIDCASSEHRTIHHLGMGKFMVAGRTIKLPSKKK